MAFPSLTLTGSPYQRGWRYGSQAAAQIRHSIASYALLFAHDCGFDWAAAQARAQPYVPV
jgi:isopenicillin-N N-acyltransferase-like protein